MKVLLTGGSGDLGRTLVPMLLDRRDTPVILGIERKLDEVVVRLAAGERDFAAMQVRLDNLDRRVARIDRDNLQQELAKLAADIKS